MTENHNDSKIFLHAISKTKEILSAHHVIIAYIRQDGTTHLIGDTERPITRLMLQTAINQVDEEYNQLKNDKLEEISQEEKNRSTG